MLYTLGLKIGISSIGWAVLQNNADGSPVKICDLGVRVFEKAESPKDGSSLSWQRHNERCMRRCNRRHRHRKERIRNLIVEYGIMTSKQMDQLFSNSVIQKDVYTLRKEGLDRMLQQDEWARVLLHLAQRRGYTCSCSSEEANEAENSQLRLALIENASLMKAEGYRTVGEMFCMNEKFSKISSDGSVYRQIRNKPGVYYSSVTRDMVAAEVHALFQSQRIYQNPFSSVQLEEKYVTILFSQRKFDEGPGGDSPYHIADARHSCSYEPQELQAFKACYTFEYFNLLQDLNHIKLITKDVSRSLTPTEREKIINLAKKTESLSFARLRKELHLPPKTHFNVVYYGGKPAEDCEKATNFKAMRSYHKIRKALDSVCKGHVASLSTDQLDQIGTILSLYQDDSDRRFSLLEIGLNDAEINCLLPLKFHKVSSLSLTAMKNLIPLLETGITYKAACETVYGVCHEQPPQKNLLLSFDHLKQIGALDSITSPVVLRPISQFCKVLNAIIRKYGSPQAIRLAVSDELNHNFPKRQKISKAKAANQSTNVKLIEQIEKIKGAKATGLDLIKFKLFQEQGGICLYSGQKLNLDQLFESGYADVDHIIPFSLSFDDSYQNKVLVLSRENQAKGCRLPLEYLSADDSWREQFINLVETTIHNNRKRQNLLKAQLSDDELHALKQKNLINHQYTAKTICKILDDFLVFSPSRIDQKVTAISGAITSYVCKRFGLKHDLKGSTLEHTMEAVLAGAITESYLSQISSHAKCREIKNADTNQLAATASSSTVASIFMNGEGTSDFPEPWPLFQKEIKARLSSDPETAIHNLHIPLYGPNEFPRPVFTSKMPTRKVTGSAHQATVRSGKMPGHSIVKTPLTSLKLTSAGEIKDYYNAASDLLLYEALRSRLQSYDGNAAKAFAEPFHKPKHDGTPGPIVNKVKICSKSNLNVPVNGGIADNGEMVRIDVYHISDDGYYFVPVYVSDTVKSELPIRAVIQGKPYNDWKVMQDKDFIFSLYRGDLIRVVSKREISLQPFSKEDHCSLLPQRKDWLLYYTGANISSGALNAVTHDRKYWKSSLGIKTLVSFEKYEVNILGEYHRVQTPEMRKIFR